MEVAVMVPQVECAPARDFGSVVVHIMSRIVPHKISNAQ